MKFWWYSVRDKISQFTELVFRLFPGRTDSLEERWFKIVILAAAGLVILMVLTGVSVFFLSLQGAEQTLVPDMRGQELSEALILLQEKELYPRVQVRFSSDPNLKGKVIDQKPSPGTTVKAGKRVTLVVSKGAVVDRIEDFRGKSLDDVRTHLQTLFTSYKPLLKIKEPVTYVFNAAAPGTILQQKPEPGTELTGLTDLVLIVSRGPETKKLKLPNFVGMDYKTAVPLLAKENIPFVFSLVDPKQGQARGYIVEQEPPSETEMEPGGRVELKIAAPAQVSGDLVFGLFAYTLPTYPVSVDMLFEAVSPSGERTVLFTMKHPGGPIAIPYLQPPNTTLVLSIFNREVIRHVVEKPQP